MPKNMKVNNLLVRFLFAFSIFTALISCSQSSAETADESRLEQLEDSIKEYQGKIADVKALLGLTTTTTMPAPMVTQPAPLEAPPGPIGCDRATTASLIISDYFYFNGDHSYSKIDSALAAISTFLATNGYGMEADGVDNASTLEDAIYIYQIPVSQLCQ